MELPRDAGADRCSLGRGITYAGFRMAEKDSCGHASALLNTRTENERENDRMRLPLHTPRFA